MSDWYDNYITKINKEAEDVKPVQVGQHILWLKAIGSKAFEKDDKCHTVGSGETFGFNELLVNQLMQFAFNQGRKDIDEKSFNAGHNQCWKEVLDNLGIEEKD